MPLVDQMQAYIRGWEETGDDRALFLRCYRMMTANMLAAIGREEFDDPAWVSQLLHRFAEYYFIALEAYEKEPAAAPAAWRLAFNATRAPGATALQKMLLGVNAHINYDLALTLVDVLGDEWEAHSPQQRASRYADHCRVNDIIGQTVDAVQDQVLEPAMPLMEVVDRLLGPLDERLLSRLLSHWREEVWRNAAQMLACGDDAQREGLVRRMEQQALETGKLIRL
ncbi:MAG: DUF5995 family protein [Chloroflexi bacterium]|nr:DUF5995 family protein [Chloroflexota bacterium]